MSNQPITGYRQLSPETIQSINAVKALANDIGGVLQRMADGNQLDPTTPSGRLTDPRWLAEARTDFQKAFMSLTRAIAQPEGF